MVTVYGMNEVIGNLSYYDSKRSEYAMDKPYSEATAETIDAEVKKLIDAAYERTIALLKDKRAELEILAKELLNKEILFQKDLETLIGKRPFDAETTYQRFTNAENGTDEEKKEDKKEEKAKVAVEKKPEAKKEENSPSDEKPEEVSKSEEEK